MMPKISGYMPTMASISCIHTGETYEDRRHKIAHKLGLGGFAIVWLAREVHKNRGFGLKFTSAELLDYRDLWSVEDHLFRTYYENFATASGRFWFDRPKGCYLCKVMPILGPVYRSSSARNVSYGCSLFEIRCRLHCRWHPFYSQNVCHNCHTVFPHLYNR